MKRLRADRPHWPRILERRFHMTYLETPPYTDHITLIQVDKVRDPLWKSFAGTPVCLVDAGYAWLQQFPAKAHHTMTTMFNPQGDVVQWYIDVCLRHGIDSDGIPWVDDLYLDIVVMPSGRWLLYDADELEAALAQDIISKADYDLAWAEARRLMQALERKEMGLLDLSRQHYGLLVG